MLCSNSMAILGLGLAVLFYLENQKPNSWLGRPPPQQLSTASPLQASSPPSPSPRPQVDKWGSAFLDPGDDGGLGLPTIGGPPAPQTAGGDAAAPPPPSFPAGPPPALPAAIAFVPPAAPPAVDAATLKGKDDVGPALACLRLTTPSLELRYPSDAEAHFEELHKALVNFSETAQRTLISKMQNAYHCAAGFCGPWLENQWTTHFLYFWEHRQPGWKLSDVFGPYIPIFVSYVDLWVSDVFEYERMINVLKTLCRRDVPYVTLSQHPSGLVASRDKVLKIMYELPNILVLSAGGYGHVPVPMFKQLEKRNKRFTKTMRRRNYLVSFMGVIDGGFRRNMAKTLKEHMEVLGMKDRFHVGHGSFDDWHKEAGTSRASLCPRGLGRTSFRLFEILQMGHVPIYLYSGTPWVPYAHVFDQFGFACTVKKLPRLLDHLNNLDDSDFEQMEAKVKSMRNTHFTTSALLHQISRFLVVGNEPSDLRCQALPPTPT